MKFLEDWNEIGLKIGREIRENVLKYYGKKEGAKIIGQSPSGDTTRLIDKISEDIAFKHLSDLNVNIVSEECGDINKNSGSSWTVVIDPIDGSFNFIHGLPCFGFCFGVFKNNKPYYGLTYELLPNNIYEAFHNEGAYLNGEKIGVKEYDKNNIVMSYYTNKDMGIVNKIKRTRCMGAFGIEMAYVSKGSLDCATDLRPHVRTTDIASSYIICKESGAIITDEYGNDFKLELTATSKKKIIVANSENILKDVFGL